MCPFRVSQHGYQKPLADLTDEELRAGLRALSAPGTIGASVKDHMTELDRRAAERHARALRRLTVALVASTIVYTLATLALVVVTWLKA